jgi:hypothetical protein
MSGFLHSRDCGGVHASRDLRDPARQSPFVTQEADDEPRFPRMLLTTNEALLISVSPGRA